MSTPKIARVSLVLLAIQLAVVCSIAAKYFLERSTCPRVWTRAVAYDPEMIMRGRYLSARLYANACDLLPATRDGAVANAPRVPGYLDMADGSTFVQGKLGASQGRLVVLRVEKDRTEKEDQPLAWPKSGKCSDVELWTPVDFYLSETAKSPFPLQHGQELWVEVTVPPSGPPRPTQLALKSSDGRWQPLNYR
jgi:hypothetical protein